MYFFVRFQGFVNIGTGILLMLSGVAVAILGFFQSVALMDVVNVYLNAASRQMLTDVRFFASVLGLIIFLVGMGLAASGQLLLVFVDMANSAEETNTLLTAMSKQK
jgi:hypothetical protein